MKILFCNIAYMNNYIGITDDDVPHGGGSFVTKNKDAHEQWIFLNDNGYCYGFVMNGGERFSIERMYFTKAKAEDCYLLPNEERTYAVGRAAQVGRGKGFGQQNYWYAESAYARTELIPQVIEYLKSQKEKRINRIAADFEDNYADANPLTVEERDLANEYWNNGEYFKFLPFAYRELREFGDVGSAYDIASALSFLCQYDEAIKWYQHIAEIDGENWGSISTLPYLYQQIQQYEKSTELAMKLLSFKETENFDAKHEVYSIIADNCFYLNQIKEAISWLDKILDESVDDGLIQHTKSVKKSWTNLL